MYGQVVNKAFALGKELPKSLQDLSFSQLVDVMWAMSNHSANFKIMDAISAALENPHQLKPIVYMLKIIEKLSQDSMQLIRYGSVLDKISSQVFMNEDLDQMPIEIKARLLNKFTKYQAGAQTKKSDDLIKKLAEDITHNLEKMDEATVMTLLDSINNQ